LKAGAPQGLYPDQDKKYWRFSSSTTALHEAVEDYNPEMVELLRSYGGDLAIKDGDKRTVIERAARNNSFSMVKYIAARMNTDEEDSYHFNQAMMICAERDKLDCVQALLNAAASINYKNLKGDGLLHIAAKSDSPHMVDFLLKRGGLSIIVMNGKNETPLHIAAENRSAGIEIAKLLISWGFTLSAINKAGMTPIQVAAKERNYSLVKYIADNYVDAKGDYQFGGALWVVASDGQINCTKSLLEAGASRIWVGCINRETLLHVAAEKNDMEMYQLLLAYNYSLSCKNNKDQTPIQAASSHKNFSIVKYTSDNFKTSVYDSYHYTQALQDAVAAGKYSCAESLLKAIGKKLNFYGSPRLLGPAAEKNQLDMIKLLLPYIESLPWDLNHDEINEAVNIARQNNHFDSIQLIAGNKKGYYYESYGKALIASVVNKKTQCMESLLQAGVLPSYLDSALFYAASNDESKTVVCLLSYGADKSSFNSDGKKFSVLYPQFASDEWFENQCDMQIAAIAMVLIQGVRQNALPYSLYLHGVDVLQLMMLHLAAMNHLPSIDKNLVRKTNLKMQGLAIDCFSSAIRQKGLFKTTQNCRNLASNLVSNKNFPEKANQHIQDYLMIDSHRPAETITLLQRYRFASREEIDNIQIKTRQREEYDVLIAKNPDSNAYYLRACYYHNQEHIRQAFADYAKAIALDQNNICASSNFIKLLMNIKDSKQLEVIDKNDLWKTIKMLLPTQEKKELLNKCLDASTVLHAYLNKPENGLLELLNMNTGRKILQEMEIARDAIKELPQLQVYQ
jgi:ankyrin repeat protein